MIKYYLNFDRCVLSRSKIGKTTNPLTDIGMKYGLKDLQTPELLVDLH